jgi:serine/threonine protein kinase/Flp pilus assembly protein TadD
VNSPAVIPSWSADLAHRVEAFEVVLDATPGADLAAFLPPPDHPLYLAVLGELVRIDLERAWAAGRRKRAAEYAARFPAVLANPSLLAAVAFEEYRQRVRAGERPDPEEYRHRYGVDTTDWGDVGPESAGRGAAAEAEFVRTAITPVPAKLVANEPTAAMPAARPTGPRFPAESARAERGRALSEAERVSYLRDAAAALPEVGTAFVGFHLVAELGRGAFGRVYLARQGDLAGRPVALKVASGLGAESHALAQLQHPNIVPIYSYHTAGPFQAVCMPYLGGTTIAQVVKCIGDRPSVPSSGKELRSTLSRGKLETAAGSSSGSAPGSAVAVPAPAGAPAPGAAAPAPGAEAEGWARLEGLPFVDAVLALGGQLADGLTHAHARGILHRDLKPANVLLTDDGRPMLLDFNLAEDTKLRGTAEWAQVGGTLPYMAPEHLAAFRRGAGALDARCDLYSLGVILFELLTGKHPFPVRKGPLRETVPLMTADRAAAPAVRALNPAVSPGVESVVSKCLAADPARRYQTAAELREDIDRHLAHRPLKFAPDPSRRERLSKWARRHPRLSSGGTVTLLAATLLLLAGGAAVYARERTRALEARGRLADHQTAFRAAQTFLDDRTRSGPRLDEGLDKLRAVLRGYGVPEDDGASAWQAAPVVRHLSAADRGRVAGDVGETFFLMTQVELLKASADDRERPAHLDRAATWNALAERYGRDRLPRAVCEQRAALAELRGDAAGAARLRRSADATPPESARDLYLAGSQYTRQGRHREALRHLERATRLDPENFSAWFLRGTAHLAVDQDELAAVCFGACVALGPEFAPAWLNRGFAFARQRLFELARDDYARALELDPTAAEAYVLRAEVCEALGDRAGAIADYTRALETGAAPARVYFKRAAAKVLTGDRAGAAADRAAGFKVAAADELSWVARAENRWLEDPKGALADVDEALKLNPWSAVALQMKAAILSEGLNRPAEALAVLNRAVEFHPDNVPVRAGRGVLLARAGKRDDALRDAKEALRRDTRPPNLYQVGCIYALTAKTHPEDRREALPLLWGGLKAGFALDIVDTDTDLAALRDDQDFKDLVRDARALNAPRAGAK